ncbi:General stress protein 69 [bacterium YEK0313]|nr:General stress protein 69 [bacterium YEK0313]
MNHRPLGRSGLSIAPIMFGGNVFGWTADEATSFALLDAFVAEGFNAIDTADVYSAWVPGHSGGESETVLGNWLKRRGKRDDVVIATKVGMWARYPDLKAATIAAAVEESLTRLKTDYIDLYQSHQDDEKTPQDEVLEAYSRLIEAGKVRAIGASNFSAARLGSALDLAEAKGLPRYDSVQPAYNLYNRQEFEGDLAKVAIERGVGVISYFGLAAGFLTGKYRSEADLAKSPRGARVKAYLDDRGFRILAALDAMSTELGATPAQVALAWLIGRPGVTAPIVSATNLNQLAEILKAARLALPAEVVAKLEAASA